MKEKSLLASSSLCRSSSSCESLRERQLWAAIFHCDGQVVITFSIAFLLDMIIFQNGEDFHLILAASSYISAQAQLGFGQFLAAIRFSSGLGSGPDHCIGS